MSSSPLVTVVIPAYNTEAYIQEAIASIQRQTIPDWELIVVDDGSTDQTVAAATQAAGGDERIRIIRLERNRGISVAANTGFDAARGEFIARLDSDDKAFEQRLAAQVALFRENPRLVVAGSHARVSNDGKESTAYCTRGDANIKARFIDGVNTIGGGTMMVRRSFVTDRYIRFNENLPSAEDIDYHISILAAGGQFENVDQELLWNRIHGASFTRSRVDVARPALQCVRLRLLALWYPTLDPADLDRILAMFFQPFAPYVDSLLADVRAVDRLVTTRANDFGQNTSIVHQIIFDRLIAMAGVYRDHKLFDASHRQAMRGFVSPAVTAALDRIEFQAPDGN
jgi:glycosyltransferase involved in cell wall biosynthesis